ncbi:MAG: AAA family ATPase [Actinomycetota bacterium]|nr:AAA family ATPase [Actinomycetota bacterium]
MALAFSGVLAEFNRAEVLTAADVHVARQLGALGGERDPDVLLAVALTVRAVRLGSVCLDLAAVRDSVVGDVAGGPAEVTDPELARQLAAVRALDWPEHAGWEWACRQSPLVREAGGGETSGETGGDASGETRGATSGETSGGSSGDTSDTSGDTSGGSGGGESADARCGNSADGSDGTSADGATRTGAGAGRPLRWSDGLLYLDRYWRQEQQVAADLDIRGDGALQPADEPRLRAAIDRMFPDDNEARQRIAAAVCAGRRLAVVAGGPGTGKTTAVARMLAAVCDQPGPPLRIALAAPTGKAAARLQQAVRDEIATFDPADAARLGELTASTLHRLLGWKPRSKSRFRHDRSNRLPFDIVVVDETSMVSLTMMARLMEAVRPQARLVLVGDPDQLASVEAGAVLGDIVARGRRAPVTTGSGTPQWVKAADPAEGGSAQGSRAQWGEAQGAKAQSNESAPGEAEGSSAAAEPVAQLVGRLCPADFAHLDSVASAQVEFGVTRLTHRFRFGGVIADLADAVRTGDPDATMAVLRSGEPAVTFTGFEAERDHPELAGFRAEMLDSSRQLIQAATAGDVLSALRVMDQHRLLCAHRRGPFGASQWAAIVQRWIADDLQAHPLPDNNTEAGFGWWIPGRPLLVGENDYELGLFNGDTGVVVRHPLRGVVAAFGDPSHPILVRPGRLSGVQSVYAMTVHKSQGSQFGSVTAILPPAESPLLTRELLYTAATRASDRVRIIGTEEAVRAAVSRPVTRASGLRRR